MDNDLIERLKTTRDELNVRMHLAAAEVRDEWSELEERFDKFQHKVAEMRDETVETTREVRDGLGVIAEELGDAYTRIRKRLDDD